MFNPTINHIALALLLATTIPTTLGHANIVKPEAAWHQPWPTNSFSAIVDADVLGAIDGATYGWGGVGAVKYIKEKMSTKYKTLKDLIMDKQKLSEPQATAECGLTIKDEAKRQTLPPELQFSNFGHPGPCEVWCDNTMLTHSDNCNTEYPDVKIAIDTSKCAGADRLTWYWLAVHSAPWQVYIDCVYLKGSTGTSNSTTNTYGPQPGAPVPAPGTVAPAPVPAPQPAPVPAPQPEPIPAPQPAPAPQTPTVVDDNSTPYQHKKCNPKY